ncbi:MAG: NERD domain-containing protein [Lautropia sp.]|nr:NERD domain-containing protein [Lautropia sp.]
MSILVYGEKASRTHENQMLQAFLNRLEDRWATSSDWIITIANAMWNGADIDLVCILPSAIVVADFKNYGGKLTGAENGGWQADGVVVKGGQKINPFQQLRGNKFAVMEWLKSKGFLTGRNLGHISVCTIFSSKIEDQLDLSSKVRSWFHVTDLANCAVLLDSISSPELSVDKDEAMEVVRRLGVREIKWTCSRPQVRDINSNPDVTYDRAPLTDHQQDALQALRTFVLADDSASFGVLGMISTGKSRLLAEIAGEIRKAGKKVIVLMPNRRLAERAGLGARSIYAHLYTGVANGDEEQAEVEGIDNVKVIPLRECSDETDCVYLLDDAHLLGNSRFSTPDGKQYGSGKLLFDFFEFAGIGSTSRKMVFFGDPYQIQRAVHEESVLWGGFQETRGLKHKALELTQVIEPSGRSARLDNACKLVSSIRAKRFAMLDLSTDHGFRVVKKRDAAIELLDRFRSNPTSVWCLSETHTQVSALTQWIRARLHGRDLLETVSVGDLLEIYVNPDKRDAFGSSELMPSGCRFTVASVGHRTQYMQGLSWVKKGPVAFHSIRCKAHGASEGEVEVFEEFLKAEKPEVDKETMIAERVLRNSSRRRRTGGSDSRQSSIKGMEQQTPSPHLPDFTYVRYGYASTVHHAQGSSQPVCFVNADTATGRHSEVVLSVAVLCNYYR